MLQDGAANKKNVPVNESWVKMNLERALFYQLFTLDYHHFNKVSQQQNAVSKKWAIVPTSPNAHQNIVINHEILYYIRAHARYFNNKNLIVFLYIHFGACHPCTVLTCGTISPSRSFFELFFSSPAACDAKIVTQTISTASTHNNRFSSGITPYVMQCTNGQSFKPEIINGMVVRFMSDHI